MVILDDDDMASLPSASSREIAVEKFVPSDQIDPMLFEKSYYLEPEKTGAKPYALLRQALLDADRMAVVTVALRQRTTVGVLRVKDDVIVLQTMMWPDEVRLPDFSVETGEVKPAEVKMANMLVETLAGDFEPSEFEDDYAEAVEAMVKTKIEGGEVNKTPTSTKSSGEVVDLLAALQRSVDAAKSARGESAQPRRSPPRRLRPRRRRPRRPRRRPPRRPAESQLFSSGSAGPPRGGNPGARRRPGPVFAPVSSEIRAARSRPCSPRHQPAHPLALHGLLGDQLADVGVEVPAPVPLLRHRHHADDPPATRATNTARASSWPSTDSSIHSRAAAATPSPVV